MAGRNANGEGSIYKRKDGRWEAAKYLQTVSGRSKRLRVYGETKTEAREKLAAAVARALHGTPIPDKVWKVGDYLDYWLENVVRANRRLTTYSRYEVAVRLHLKPDLGTYSFDRLSVPVVQFFLNHKLESGASVRNAHIMREVLSATLTNAQREELVSRNVARLVTLPTYEPDEVQPWSADEASYFLEAIRTSPYQAAFALLMLYGLRRGEVLGLRWNNIDFSTGEIHIRQQVQYAKGQLYVAPLKTNAGKRNLPLLAAARILLTNQRERITDDTGLVFTSSDGGPVRPRAFSRYFERFIRRHDLRPIRLHDLRHTTNTLLKKLGVPARDRQLILGHADISTTQGIYEHDDMASRRENLERIEKLLLSEQEPSKGGIYCRQNSRQPTFYTRQLSSYTSGRDGGIRTPGPRFWRSNHYSLRDRLTSIDEVARARTRAWKLGCVAVKIAVNETGLESAS